MEEKLHLAETNHILPRHRNTLPNRMHNGILRRQATSRKKAQRESDINLADEIEEQLREEADARCASNARTQELREKKKALQAVTGVRKRRQAGKAIKGKTASIPDGSDSSDEENTALSPLDPLDKVEDEQFPGSASQIQDDTWELDYIDNTEEPPVPSTSNLLQVPQHRLREYTPCEPIPSSSRTQSADLVIRSSAHPHHATFLTPSDNFHDPSNDDDDLFGLYYHSRASTITPRRRPPRTDADGFVMAQFLSSPPQY